ncbi:MAG: phosphoribosylaminoimidazolesuccinocarboxamide synthase [Parcubacteria group bacterium]|jgi:phosphoribosylaminoimidazole carboxylase/phosphoribosylaminoimidazole-succinocarboxamide synthase
MPFENFNPFSNLINHITMPGHQKGKLIAEGKTKKIWENKNDPKTVIVEYKDDITAFNDPKYTKKFKSKGRNSNLTTCRVFELLKKAGIPTHFVRQISEVEFVAKPCRMILVEAVPRRYAFGSYLKRNPHMTVPAGEPPHYFSRIANEYFLKTTKGGVVIDGEKLIEGLTSEQDDPVILNPKEENWKPLFAWKPVWDEKSDLKRTISRKKVLLGESGRLEKMDEIMKKTFLVLEGAFMQRNFRILDLKIEFGITEDGELVVADVIDNDSWRLRDPEWKEFSKQAFRDGEDLEMIEPKYQLVADLTQDFPKISDQALVLWTGSEKDEMPEVPKIPGVKVVEKIISGHKKTALCLEELKRLEREFPAGGVIIAKVGMSNGLGPILAAHTHWPVISVPATIKTFPGDAWSSLRMPSDLPMGTIEKDSNAVDFALNILAKKNPIAYMIRRFKMEEFDGEE